MVIQLVCCIVVTFVFFNFIHAGKRSWVMSAGQMSPLAGGRHGSPVLSPTASLDRPSASLQRMYSMDLPTLPVGPTVVQHPPGNLVLRTLYLILPTFRKN